MEVSHTNDRTTPLLRACVLLFSSVAVLYSLGKDVLRPWDEAIYAQIAKEMLKQHHWLTPYWNQQPWFEKPPLLMWSTAFFYQVFGISEFSSRLFTALCGVAAVWLTFELGRRLRDAWTGLLAAILLLTANLFLEFSRKGTLDVPLATCFALAAYGYVQERTEGRRYWYLIGVAVGLGFMLKGAGGVIAPLALLLALLWDGRLGEARSSEFRTSAVLALVLSVPWHLAMLILHGRVFWAEYIGYHVFARVRGVEGHAGPIYYYMAEYWHAFTFVAVIALIGLFLKLRQRDTGWSIVICFTLVITTLYSLVGTKLPGYAIPAFPFLCLLAASAISDLPYATKYAPACAMVVVLVYGSLQWDALKKIYRGDYGAEPVSIDRLALGPLTELTVRARADQNDTNTLPLILCMDGVMIPKQQPLFYADRPIIQAFVAVPPANPEVQKRYLDAIPLAEAVTSRPAPIIAWKAVYPELAYSGRYRFTYIADQGPLVLGLISSNSRGPQ